MAALISSARNSRHKKLFININYEAQTHTPGTQQHTHTHTGSQCAGIVEYALAKWVHKFHLAQTLANISIKRRRCLPLWRCHGWHRMCPTCDGIAARCAWHSRSPASAYNPVRDPQRAQCRHCVWRVDPERDKKKRGKFSVTVLWVKVCVSVCVLVRAWGVRFY